MAGEPGERDGGMGCMSEGYAKDQSCDHTSELFLEGTLEPAVVWVLSNPKLAVVALAD